MSKITARKIALDGELVFVLPGDPASIAQMKEQVAKAMFGSAHGKGIDWEDFDQLHGEWRHHATAALASLGIGSKEKKS